MIIKKYTIHPTYNSPLIDHPPEDVYLVSKKYPIGVVADGVTILDRNRGGIYPIFPDGQSGPKKVSDIFCQKAISYLEKQYPSIRPETILRAFQEGNEDVKRLNQKLFKIKSTDPNYGVDVFATIAAIACIIDNNLVYGFLTDCGMAVINRKAQLKLITPEIWPRIQKPSDKNLRTILKKGEGNYRRYRKYVRNNPQLVREGKFYSHGVINGQEGMIKYVEVGQMKLNQGDTVVLFTDGFRYYFQYQEFLIILAEKELNQLRKKLDFLGFDLLKKGKPTLKYGTERTLVLIRN